MRLGRSSRLLSAAVVALSLVASLSAMAEAPAARVRLRWEIEANVFRPDAPAGRSRAALTLINLDSRALPARGWAIYFNCLAGVRTGEIEGHLKLETLGGTLFRLRPIEGFAGLDAGQTLRVVFEHPEIVVKSSKAPIGPYLVLDDTPGVGRAIVEYEIASVRPAEPRASGPAASAPLLTAEAIYARNATIADVPEQKLPPVFPTPRQYERGAGTLHWPARPPVVGSQALRQEVAFANHLLQPYFRPGQADAAQAPLRLAVAPLKGQPSPEAYELTVDSRGGVTVTGSSAAGVARGLQSLRALLPLEAQPEHGLELAAWTIRDAPRFDYRGLQLDVARNFQRKEVVYRLLDLMARYKLNVLHLHLTDDEGWRLEIAGLPELTEVGGRRGHGPDATLQLPPAHGSGPDVNDPHGSGYYSRTDYIDILKHAAAAHIEVIPEIEMPGHARAAVKSMESRFRRLAAERRPEARQYLVSDRDDRSVYESAQLYTDNVMNPGVESTYAFIEHVLAAVVALHREAGVPLRTIHVGGDELPAGAWERSPACLALMRSRHLASAADVWNYFYDRVDRMLRRHGLFASGWEELGSRRVKLRGEPRLIPNPTFSQRGFSVYVWDDLWGAEDLGYRLANAGYQTVLAPVSHLYFDMAYNQNPDEPGANWAPYIDLDTVYDFIPLDFVRRAATDSTPVPGRDGLTDFGARNIRGLEGQLFSETMRDPARIDYMLMPRLLGLAERAWAPDPEWARETDPARAQRLHDAAWSTFVSQVGKQVLPRLDADGAGVAYRIPPPGLTLVDGQVLANHQLPGFTLRYTTDGTEPTAASPVMSAPIGAKGIIRVAAFDRNGRHGTSSRIDVLQEAR